MPYLIKPPIPESRIDKLIEEAKMLPDIVETRDEDKDEISGQETQIPVQVGANINPADYIQIPNIFPVKLVSKFEVQGLNNLNYKNSHKKTLERGLKIPTPAIFIPHLINIRDAYESNGRIKIYDGLGNPISQQELEDIYKHLTTNHIAAYGIQGQEGAWSWLNAKFISGTGFKDFDLETIVGIDAQGNLFTNKEPLEECIWEDCFVDLEHINFNNQGLPKPKTKSENQNYEQGKNIRFWYPRQDCVARFNAYSSRVNLICDGGSEDSIASLGVFGCAEGTHAPK